MILDFFWGRMRVKFALEFLALVFPSWSQNGSSVLAWVDVTASAAVAAWSLLYSVIFPPSFPQRCLSTFCHSQWLLALLFGLRQRPCSSDSFCCFRGMILILYHLIPCLVLMAFSPSAVISKPVLFSVSWGVCIFSGSGGRVFFFSLWKKG